MPSEAKQSFSAVLGPKFPLGEWAQSPPKASRKNSSLRKNLLHHRGAQGQENPLGLAHLGPQIRGPVMPYSLGFSFLVSKLLCLLSKRESFFCACRPDLPSSSGAGSGPCLICQGEPHAVSFSLKTLHSPTSKPIQPPPASEALSCIFHPFQPSLGVPSHLSSLSVYPVINSLITG